MKFTPFVIALLVAAALYILVIERDTALAFLGAGEDEATSEVDETEDDTAEPVDASPSDGLVSVVVARTVGETIDSAVILRGRTEAARSVVVSSETSGLVISEPLPKGSFVEAGEVMCRLDPGTREAALAEARARLAEAQGRVPEALASVAEATARVREAEIEVNNARRLSEDGFASETRLISAEATFQAAEAGLSRATTSIASAEAGIEAAEAAVAAAETEIERLTIRAPFAGLLETDTAELGTLMQPGAACVTIIQIDPIKLVGFVPELQVDSVEVGSPVQAALANGTVVEGLVTFLSRSADPQTRTFRLEVTIPNPDMSIRDGQTAEIIVAAEGRLAHLIPQSALTLDDEGTFGVRIVGENNVVEFIPVQQIRDTPQGAWLAGLPETADVIVVGQEFVVAGVTVHPTPLNADGSLPQTIATPDTEASQ